VVVTPDHKEKCRTGEWYEAHGEQRNRKRT